ncbi:MAG: phenylacetate--CoA ligase family protein [Alphaproteobacteria bacterium]|nr:MAG: phenylacetate--CoA ligase family protein [Alphaproteobacteria bacterium]
MTDHFDALEVRDPAAREADFFARFVPFLEQAIAEAPGLKRHLGDIDSATISSRAALAGLPVLRKAALMAMQQADPPFGGFVPAKVLAGGRVFMSPGPVWEPQGLGPDPWNAARALHAAGFKKGDIVINCFGYQMTPGGFILDEGLRALGCTVFPAGPGNTESQIAAIAALKPAGYVGTPDFLKVILDKAAEAGTDTGSIAKALVSGGALFASLRDEYAKRGIAVLQAYATADLGVIAYESAIDGSACEGMIVNEDILVEIVRPGTGEPVPDGEVGEVVVTTLNAAYPLVRFGTGDLSAVLAGASPCGRSNVRLKGWMGRADQRTKVKGMFVDPAQIAAIVKAVPGIAKARLVVARQGEKDAMTLQVEPVQGAILDEAGLAAALQAETGLKGAVEIVAAGALPNDGKIIDDQRDYE